jgi:hypothetical protein
LSNLSSQIKKAIGVGRSPLLATGSHRQSENDPESKKHNLNSPDSNNIVESNSSGESLKKLRTKRFTLGENPPGNEYKGLPLEFDTIEEEDPFNLSQ